jgi:hypothetical protein
MVSTHFEHPLSHFHLRERVRLNEELTVLVSTVDLSLPEFGITGKGYETCLFFNPDQGDDEEFSHVVGWYASEKAALAGHEAFRNPEVLRYVRDALRALEAW